MTGGEVIIEKNPSKKYCISKKEPLCDSIIWDMLQNYYKKAAINAWKENVVPSFVTSNSKLAKDYARVIINYMKDWFNSNECDRNVPIYILEIGAGHGKFTYLILRALSKYKKFFKSMNLPERPFVYVFTDVAKDNITYCMNNERLKKYINRGNSSEQTYTSKNNSYEDSEYEKHDINYYSSSNDSCCTFSCDETTYAEEKNKHDSNFSMLDFAFFDGNETTDKIYLEIGKKYIPSDTPIVLICNYVLDSLLTDAWIVNGENDFKRALLSVYSPYEEKDKKNADIMLRMSVTWDWEKVDIEEEVKKTGTDKPSNYLRNYEDIYTVLKLYSYFNECLSFVFPVGAFILFQRMLKLSNNKLLCLIGDKGYQSYEEFRGYRDPHIVVHGSLSFMVNLNAICLFFLSIGGYYIYTPYSDNFQIVTLLMHQKKDNVKNEKQSKTSITNNSTLTETLSNKKKFYIIDFFKKNIKDTQNKNANNLSNDFIPTKENSRNSRIYSKNSVNAQNVYKKIKKINLRNLNNMTIKFGGTIASFYDNIEQIPPDLLISWQKSVIHNINHNAANVNIKELISLLRYSNYDSDVFFNIRNSFINLACYPNINGRTEKDILLDIKECYNNYYSLKNDEDIADICGHVCMKFGEFEKSIFYLKESLRKFKNTRHSSTYINIASCYKILRNYNKSIKFIRSAIKLSNKENKNKNIPLNNNSHSYDLLYNIQFCSNPITYAMIGINYYVQNDGLYYLSFENRIKLKYIFLLSKEEEKVLKYMRMKYKHSSYDKTSNNFNLSEIKIIKVYNGNKTLSLEELYELEKENNPNDTMVGLNNIDEKNKCYDNLEYLKNNLTNCLDQFDFQFCVIDVPWIIKSDIVDLMLEKSKHIFTYGTLSDSSKRSMDVISKYKKVAEHISWVNNNYIHDECLYEARESLGYIKNVISITVTHYSTSAYTNQNESINCKEIFINDLCSILNSLQIILNFNLTGLTANFLKKQNSEKKEHTNPIELEENIEILTNGFLNPNNDDQKILYNEENSTGCYVCFTGMLMFSQCKQLSEYSNVYGNYLLMNNKNEEFITKINISGLNGSLCLKKTLSNWTVNVFNVNNDKIFDKSGRISASQNSNDVFINQYLIKTNGKNNNIKHFSEYDLDCHFKDSNESIDSDIDILEFSSSDDNDYKSDKGKKVDEQSNNCTVSNNILSDNNENKISFDRNLEILKDIPGKRFYSTSKEICENINLDENLIDITVNNNCFYSRIIEGINLSHKKEGSMVYFKYNSK
ncbi:conserved Plasmodium protein, unknown function [Plasmodium gallinaceum]|uniref:Uncharacterized protein n=1 Tax=Plasmodium gallinaceum TaxID=5849 RepID=A0A1J1GN76_PLAGA|nr:conserved Plasmodium protein, unknown function [Plasmodium gallinaceum]CRG93787.1 conserved Plasmodium protein, unknown function [Plasmodium gallinaceum]